jgi:hypothetical protein
MVSGRQNMTPAATPNSVRHDVHVVFSSQLEDHYCYGSKADQPGWILMVLTHVAAHGYHDHAEL